MEHKVSVPGLYIGKKRSREEALAWSLQGEPAPAVLAWSDVPSAEVLHAAAVYVGAPSSIK
jgi:hypothetical protein